ncbi:MAG: hypothetical protein ACYDB6_08955 [Candidatus Limnocylindrales bacterium]
MLFLQLLVIAIAATIGLAMLRLAREHVGRTPLPEGRRRLAFMLAFLILPPIALGSLIEPATAAGQAGGIAWVPLYIVLLTVLAVLMWIVALIVRLVAPGRSGRLLLVALGGTERDPEEVHVEPPLTAELAESMALVERTNAAFPRGAEFPAQVDRPGFRFAWDSLDAATATLEGHIADDYRLGVGVASAATATARDARSRLDTLRGLAVGRGQAWAGS